MLGEIGNRLLGSIAGKLFAGDALEGAVVDDLSSRLEPHINAHIAAVRSRLLETITPAPPATLQAELGAMGLHLNDDQIKAVWLATFRAIAAERRPRLTAIDGGAATS